MEIRFYTQDLRFLGVAENQTSVVWHRKYFGVGEFSIYIPITDDNVRYCQLGNIVWLQGAVEAGVIEDLLYEETANQNHITAKGRFLESYMDRRIIYPTLNFEGTAEEGMRTLFESISTPIPYVELGEENEYEDEVSFQCTWKELLTYEQKLAMAFNYGIRFRPDFSNRKIYFDIYKGLDRTRSQHERAFTEFSEDFDNINQASFSDNDQLEKTVAYVAGQGEGMDREVVIVGDTESTGYVRRELYVDAKDLSPDDLTTAEYRAQLAQRGLEKLNENQRSTTFECVTIPTGNFRYKVDYDLGDIVTTKKINWNVGQDLRITEIQEIYEHGEMQVVPTLGTPLPTTLDMED